MPEVLHTYWVRILNNNGKTGVVLDAPLSFILTLETITF
jgi:hypothetical protein